MSPPATATELLTGGRERGLYANAALARLTPGTGLRLDTAGPATWFDLASLTKPLVTAALAARCHAAGELPLDAPAARWLPAWQGEAKAAITVEDLLRHRSGLPPVGSWFGAQDPATPDAAAVRDAALAAPLVAKPGSTTAYSDTGFIALGAVVEAVVGQDMAGAFKAEIATPLGLADELRYGPLPPALTALAAGTGPCLWRGRMLRGEVHDPNAYALGPHAPHAGLFGTAAAVVRLGAAWLGLDGTALPGVPDGVRRAFLAVPPAGRPLGWDRLGPGPSQAGAGASSTAVGHLGFTGTSLWLDSERQAVVAMLTDRIAHDREGTAFRRWRPGLHAAVWAELDAER